MNVTKEKVNAGLENEAVKSDVTVCPKCQTKNKSTALYCRCGTALNNECSHCGARNLITAKFCGGCKTKLL